MEKTIAKESEMCDVQIRIRGTVPIHLCNIVGDGVCTCKKRYSTVGEMYGDTVSDIVRAFFASV